MKKHAQKTLIFIILLSLKISSQVRINTNSPVSTFDVNERPTDKNFANGITVPSITKNQLIKKTKYNSYQIGTVVYVTDISGPTDSTKAMNVNTTTYY